MDDTIFIVIVVCLVAYFGSKVIIKSMTNKSRGFDRRDFNRALKDGRVQVFIEANDGNTVPVKRKVNYANLSNQDIRAEAEKIAAELKDVKEALSLFRKRDRILDSGSDTDYMDKKYDVYKEACYKMTDRFCCYLPLAEAAHYLDFPLPVFEKIGEVISQDEYDRLLNQYPEVKGQFSDFCEDTEFEEIVTSKLDKTAKRKLLEIKHIYDGKSSYDDKKKAIDKILKSSARVREFYDSYIADDLLKDAA